MTESSKSITNFRAGNFLEKSKGIKKKFDKIQDESLKRLSNFYTYIGYLSSGAIILSLNLVNNFRETITTSFVSFGNFYVNSLYFLFAAWFFFLIALVTSLYRNLSHIHYCIWENRRSLAEFCKEKHNLTKELLNNQMLYNVNDFNEAELDKNIIKWDASIKNLNYKEKMEYIAFSLSEKLARWCLMLGMLALIILGISLFL